MLGWHVSVYRQTDGGASPAAEDCSEGARLAVWQAGVRGLRWLDDLVKGGQAIDLGGGGYPCRYTAKAEYLVPRIAGGPPEARDTWGCDEHDIITPAWEGRTVMDQAAIDTCLPDEWLLVVAWDES